MARSTTVMASRFWNTSMMLCDNSASRLQEITMRFVWLKSLIVCGALMITSAQPLCPVSQSIESTIANADLVFIGKIVQFEIGEGEPESEINHVREVVIEKILKDNNRLIAPLKEHYPSPGMQIGLPYAPSVITDWKDRSSRLLIAYDSDIPLLTKVNELSAGKVQVLTAGLEILREPEAVVQAAENAVNRFPAWVKRVHTFEMKVPRERIVGTEWEKLYDGGEFLIVSVPVDKQLEKRAHDYIRSEDAEKRGEGARALAYFKSDENIALVKPLLADPAITYVHPAYEDKAEERVYGVRYEAYRTLQCWEIEVEKPVIEEEARKSSRPTVSDDARETVDSTRKNDEMNIKQLFERCENSTGADYLKAEKELIAAKLSTDQLRTQLNDPDPITRLTARCAILLQGNQIAADLDVVFLSWEREPARYREAGVDGPFPEQYAHSCSESPDRVEVLALRLVKLTIDDAVCATGIILHLQKLNLPETHGALLRFAVDTNDSSLREAATNALIEMKAVGVEEMIAEEENRLKKLNRKFPDGFAALKKAAISRPPAKSPQDLVADAVAQSGEQYLQAEQALLGSLDATSAIETLAKHTDPFASLLGRCLLARKQGNAGRIQSALKFLEHEPERIAPTILRVPQPESVAGILAHRYSGTTEFVALRLAKQTIENDRCCLGVILHIKQQNIPGAHAALLRFAVDTESEPLRQAAVEGIREMKMPEIESLIAAEEQRLKKLGRETPAAIITLKEQR